MFPTIGHLINYIFNTNIIFPIPSYGVMLASAFIVGFLVLKIELKRKEKEGLLSSYSKKVMIGKPAGFVELAISGFFGFILGFKLIGIVIDYSLFTISPPDYIFSLEGSLIGGLVLAAIMIYSNFRSKQKKKLQEPKWIEEEIHPYQHSATILFVAAISGIIGAKLFHQFEYPQDFLADPIGAIFSSGGLTFYGGLIVGTVTVLYFCKKKGISVTQMMDVAAPAILLAYATGRVGCQLSGDGCWGVINLAFASPEVTDGVYLAKPAWLGFMPDWIWAFNYPNNVINEGMLMTDCAGKYCHVLNEPVFPTPFYETTINGIFFLILWSIRKKIKIPGILFAFAFIMNGFERFFIEKIRVNVKFDFLGMRVTQAEIISVCLVVAGIVLIWFFQRRHKKLKKA